VQETYDDWYYRDVFVMVSDVNKKLGLKAKTKDLGHEAKAKHSRYQCQGQGLISLKISDDG